MDPRARFRRLRVSLLVALNVMGLVALLFVLNVLPPPPTRSAAPMTLVAHRGDITRYPENTLEALMAAAEYPDVAVEFDVWPSADGTWWVMHDPDVSVTTDGRGIVSELTDTQLSQLRITGGTGYDAARHADAFRVPRLDEVLTAMARVGATVYLHCKPVDLNSATDLAERIVSHGLAGRAAMIIPTEEQAGAVKAVDDRIRTVVIHEYFDPPAADPAVDAWLTDAFHIPSIAFIATRAYDVEGYANLRVPLRDELTHLERLYRWNGAAFITNDVPSALERIRQLTNASP